MPDASPLAVQGPLAVEVVADLLGDWVRDLGIFRFRPAVLDGIPLWVGRSGWSKQGGFELYLLDRTRGGDLWRRVAEAGTPHGIGPGAPNAVERDRELPAFLPGRHPRRRRSFRGETRAVPGSGFGRRLHRSGTPW